MSSRTSCDCPSPIHQFSRLLTSSPSPNIVFTGVLHMDAGSPMKKFGFRLGLFMLMIGNHSCITLMESMFSGYVPFYHNRYSYTNINTNVSLPSNNNWKYKGKLQHAGTGGIDTTALYVSENKEDDGSVRHTYLRFWKSGQIISGDSGKMFPTIVEAESISDVQVGYYYIEENKVKVELHSSGSTPTCFEYENYLIENGVLILVDSWEKREYTKYFAGELFSTPYW